MPEAAHALSQCAIYLSLAPKSNATGRSLGAARTHIREHGAELPPAALRSAAYPGARALGRGRGYDYPHDHPGHVNDQEHLPPSVADERFYDPGDGEPALRERLAEIRRARGRG
jgi:putative ATPase